MTTRKPPKQFKGAATKPPKLPKNLPLAPNPPSPTPAPKPPQKLAKGGMVKGKKKGC